MIPRIDLDLRSLAAFRILLGLYFIWDIYSRVSLGRWDLGWYTSGEELSFLEESDSPHQGFIHLLWFYRGSSSEQAFLFLLTSIVAAGYALGLPACGFPLWLLVTAQQNRNMYVHDGSDNFSRQLLLWTCFLPMRNSFTLAKKKNRRSAVVVSTIAAYGLATQIVLMYLGTVFHRTFDLYSPLQIHKSDWLPPKLDAVHYALSGSFSVRENFVNRLIRKSSFLSKAMTLSAMCIETICPVACFLAGPRRRLPFALILVSLHLGLFLCMRLPHWQNITMITHATVWTPSHLWEHWLPSPKEKSAKPKPIQYSANHQSSHVSCLCQSLLLLYMLLNFAGERRWMKKFDNGDIGEALRISQYWVMFSSVDHNARFLSLTSTFSNGTKYDVFEYIRTKRIEPLQLIEFRTSEYYPSARWERVLYTWASNNQKKPIRKFLLALCHLLPPETKTVDWLVEKRGIMPPNGHERFRAKLKDNHTVYSVLCSPTKMTSLQ